MKNIILAALVVCAVRPAAAQVLPQSPPPPPTKPGEVRILVTPGIPVELVMSDGRCLAVSLAADRSAAWLEVSHPKIASWLGKPEDGWTVDLCKTQTGSAR